MLEEFFFVFSFFLMRRNVHIISSLSIENIINVIVSSVTLFGTFTLCRSLFVSLLYNSRLLINLFLLDQIFLCSLLVVELTFLYDQLKYLFVYNMRWNNRIISWSPIENPWLLGLCLCYWFVMRITVWYFCLL